MYAGESHDREPEERGRGDGERADRGQPCWADRPEACAHGEQRPQEEVEAQTGPPKEGLREGRHRERAGEDDRGTPGGGVRHTEEPKWTQSR